MSMGAVAMSLSTIIVAERPIASPTTTAERGSMKSQAQCGFWSALVTAMPSADCHYGQGASSI